MKNQQKWIVGFSLLLIMAMIFVACGGGAAEEPAEPEEAEAPAEEEAEAPAEEEAEAPAEEMAEGAVPLSLWYHGAGNTEERDVIAQIIDDFNASQSDYVVEIEDFPQESTTNPSSPPPWPATCPTSSTWTAPSCPTGPGLATWRRSNCPGALDGFLPGAIGSGMAKFTPSVCGMRP